MQISRRDLTMLLPALAASAQAAETDKRMLETKAFPYEDLPVKVNGQNKSRAVFDWQTHTGYPIEVHMTELAPGQMPHAPHKHVHEEVMMLKNGQLDAMYGGQTVRLKAGSVLYMASGVEHGWKNTGTGPAEYFVIALGQKGPA